MRTKAFANSCGVRIVLWWGLKDFAERQGWKEVKR